LRSARSRFHASRAAVEPPCTAPWTPSAGPARCRKAQRRSRPSSPGALVDERSLAVTLTASGAALRARAEQIPAAIVQRLGLPVEDLQHLHVVLTQVIAAAYRPTPVDPKGQPIDPGAQPSA
jgi:hypothetical protein